MGRHEKRYHYEWDVECLYLTHRAMRTVQSSIKKFLFHCRITTKKHAFSDTAFSGLCSKTGRHRTCYRDYVTCRTCTASSTFLLDRPTPITVAGPYKFQPPTLPFSDVIRMCSLQAGMAGLTCYHAR